MQLLIFASENRSVNFELDFDGLKIARTYDGAIQPDHGRKIFSKSEKRLEPGKRSYLRLDRRNHQAKCDRLVLDTSPIQHLDSLYEILVAAQRRIRKLEQVHRSGA